MKAIVSGAALVLLSAQVHAGWSYRDWEDPVSGDKMKQAIARSEVVPERMVASLILRRSEVEDTTVMVVLSRGQFWCPDRCEVKLRFDDRLPPLAVLAGRANDGSTDVLFLAGERFILEELLVSKRVRIEVPLFRAGRQVYTFSVTNLRWDLPAVYSLPEQSSPQEGWGGEYRRGR